jgi:hypothetical protein
VGGPLPVSEPKFHTPLADAFLEAAKYLGHSVRDINAGSRGLISFLNAAKLIFFLEILPSRVTS